MGKRGRAKTPTAELERTGSWRAKQRGDEPTLPIGVPEPPEGMSDGAREFWDYYVPLLYAKGIVTEDNRDMLRGMCDYLDDARCLRTFIDEAKAMNDPKLLMERTQAGSKRHPITDLQRLAFSDALALMKQFGMSPATRSDTTRAADTPRAKGTAEDIIATMLAEANSK